MDKLIKELVLNRVQLNDRIAAINVEMAVTKAHQAKLEGHLSEVTHWLAELDKSELLPPAQEHTPEIHGEGMQPLE
jgi:hypothetical protein